MVASMVDLPLSLNAGLATMHWLSSQYQRKINWEEVENMGIGNEHLLGSVRLVVAFLTFFLIQNI